MFTRRFSIADNHAAPAGCKTDALETFSGAACVLGASGFVTKEEVNWQGISRTAVIPVEAIQNAYNDAVMSGRIALASDIGQLWLKMLGEQKVALLALHNSYPNFAGWRCRDRVIGL